MEQTINSLDMSALELTDTQRGALINTYGPVVVSEITRAYTRYLKNSRKRGDHTAIELTMRVGLYTVLDAACAKFVSVKS